MTSRAGGAISWYSYNQPSQIAYGGNSAQFSYNANHQRWKQVANCGSVSETTWYIEGMLEKVLRSGVTEFRHLIRPAAARRSTRGATTGRTTPTTSRAITSAATISPQTAPP